MGAEPTVTVRQVRGTRYDEVVALVELATGTAPAETVGRVCERLRARPLRVVGFGVPPVEGAILRGVPQVLVHGQHPTADPRPAVEVTAVVPHPDAPVEVVPMDPQAVLVRTPEAERLVLCLQRPPGSGIAEQGAAAFAEVERTLAAAGLAPRHITRTWYFLGDIAGEYAAFNAARDAAFDRWGLDRYPASTGIGAWLPPGCHLAVVVEATAVRGDNPAGVLDTALQRPPSDYGPRFVRGNGWCHDGLRTVNVSGISSIDPTGASITADTPDPLVDYAMRSFADVLAAGGLELADLVSSYVYCKDDGVRAAFARYRDRHRLTFAHAVTNADVCRPDLVFEIEGRAVRAEPAPPPGPPP